MNKVNQVAQASIGNTVESRDGHATVAGSDSAITSLGIFSWEGADEL